MACVTLPSSSFSAIGADSFTAPPSVSPSASMRPLESSVPVSAFISIEPPLAPFASIFEEASSVTSLTAFSTILPPSPTTARLAETRPEFLTSEP